MKTLQVLSLFHMCYCLKNEGVLQFVYCFLLLKTLIFYHSVRKVIRPFPWIYEWKIWNVLLENIMASLLVFSLSFLQRHALLDTSSLVSFHFYVWMLLQESDYSHRFWITTNLHHTENSWRNNGLRICIEYLSVSLVNKE